MSILTKGAPFPKSLGGTVDLYHDVRELRLAMQAEVAELKARETELQEHLLENISKRNETGVAGSRYRAQVTTSEKYNVEDWPILHSWIRKHDAFEFLGKSLNQKEAEAWVKENNRLLPGTSRVHVPSLSVTKIPGT